MSSKGVPEFADGIKVRDGIEMSYQRRLIPGTADQYEEKPILRLDYHVDCLTSSTGTNLTFKSTLLGTTLTNPAVKIGQKVNGQPTTITYNGTWTIDRISVADRGDNTSRVNISAFKEGKFIESGAIDTSLTDLIASTFNPTQKGVLNS